MTGWAERIRVGGTEADFERAVERVRPAAERVGATQFEVLTAAALAEFAEAGVDVAAVEAGLGGRLDATNVLDAPVVVLTNVALEHTEVLGDTREAIAAEKLAVVRPGATVVLGEPEWEGLARENGAARVILETGGNTALGAAASAVFLGRRVVPMRRAAARSLEWRGDELWDGGHKPRPSGYIEPHLPALGRDRRSILSDKDVDGILRPALHARAGVVATRRASARAGGRGARTARPPYFGHVEAVADSVQAVARARELGTPVLVIGSLYLLNDPLSDSARVA